MDTIYDQEKKGGCSRHDESKDWEKVLNLMMPFANGHIHSRMFGIIMKLNVCDILEDGPKTAKQVGERIGMNEDACNRLLRYFVAHELFKEDRNNLGTFEKTQTSTLFSKNGGGGSSWMGKFQTNDYHYKMFEPLLETFQTNKATGPSSIGLKNFWELLDKDQEYKELFNQSMRFFTQTLISNIIHSKEIDFSKYETVVDIGGNHGVLVGSLLDHYNSIKRGINFDKDIVINSCQQDKYRHDKLEHVSGDFFTKVPEADCYVLKHILHDWPTDDCVRILKTISKSMKPNGRIYVFDLIIDPTKGYSKHDVTVDIVMFQLLNSRERTLTEWKQLFEMSGLRLEKVITDIKVGCLVLTKQ